MRDKDFISASDLAEFVYCPQCWWNKIHGVKKDSPFLARGIEHHNQVYFLQKIKRVLIISLSGIIIFLMLGLMSWWILERVGM